MRGGAALRARRLTKQTPPRRAAAAPRTPLFLRHSSHPHGLRMTHTACCGTGQVMPRFMGTSFRVWNAETTNIAFQKQLQLVCPSLFSAVILRNASLNARSEICSFFVRTTERPDELWTVGVPSEKQSSVISKFIRRVTHPSRRADTLFVARGPADFHKARVMTCVCHMVFLAHSTLLRPPVIASGTPFNQLTAERRLVSLVPESWRTEHKLNRHLAVTQRNFSTAIQEMNDAFRRRRWILSG